MIAQLHSGDTGRTLQRRLRKQAVATFHQPHGGADDHDQREKANREARANAYRQPVSSEHQSTFKERVEKQGALFRPVFPGRTASNNTNT
jgi:hypothetical protein